MAERSDIAAADEAELAVLVAQAATDRRPLLVQGFGSKSGMLRPVQADATISTRRLSGVTLYSPRELVISALAGTPLDEIEAVLRQSGQQLTAEPPDLSGLLGSDAGQSWGGMVAGNLSGPRRIAWGATRDHVMGIRVINGRGEVIRSGGRVLKNVTGLDLCKLLAGSQGTLGIMTEITLKVLPAPATTGAIIIRGLDANQGVSALSAALGSPFGVSGAAFLPSWAAETIPALGSQSVTIIRIEDFPHSVAYRLDQLSGVLARFGRAETLDDLTSRAVWKAIRDVTPLRPGASEAVWHLSTRPSHGPQLLALIEAAGARGIMDWGGGRIWAAGPGTEAVHGTVMRAVRDLGGHFTLMRAPDSLRTAVPVVPEEAPALAALTRRVKAAMDPAGIFNPGRLYAGL
ncbi:FAD-binding protein [Acidisoma cellulosilytica]|uniref:FAD-binding protein n=1 Tax=Acidisoma cellulosilyticum TaxID=2802395 RepID=A0A964E2P2_9PROT|nr:FAD-binding protein [Acidisoma cellulosilyticum]MCB8879616.1 FAD-binding protein [Acidisoma cellulosilyticum]